MSIENAILELASAIRELAASNQGKAVVTTLEEAVEKVEKSVPTAAQKAVADAKAAAESATKVKKPEPKPEVKEEAKEEVKDEAPALDYDKDVAPALTAYAKSQGRDKLVALLGKYQAKNGAGIKSEDYAAVLADIQTEALV
jgi:hypothetical protein